MKKISIHSLVKKKRQQEKITMITCYDYTSAKILQQSDIDAILVGDSVAMVIHGYRDTTYATVEMLANHTRAVAAGIDSKLIIADLPFMSYHKSQYDTLANVETLMRAGAHGVKLERVHGNETMIEYIVNAGIPVVAHIGLTVQSIHQLGGFKVQGRDAASREKLIREAACAEALGCCAIVLECMPADIGSEITKLVKIPTIGIGAGNETDGQVLVLHDLLGLQTEISPKFLKRYLNGAELVKASINHYVQEVASSRFPAKEHCYE